VGAWAPNTSRVEARRTVPEDKWSPPLGKRGIVRKGSDSIGTWVRSSNLVARSDIPGPDLVLSRLLPSASTGPVAYRPTITSAPRYPRSNNVYFPSCAFLSESGGLLASPQFT